jgi:D-alanyl-D-alanine carboxypeptidase/D-alanyl-D-alanine-endopeptidase (penicillin-binding protein 4)
MTNHFGPGWAWDDYSYAYSSERSPLPIYGNSFSVKGSGKNVLIEPPYMKKYLTISGQSRRTSGVRDLDSNDFTVSLSDNSNEKFEFSIPLKVDPILTAQLLSDTLKKEAMAVDMQPLQTPPDTQLPVDSLYKVMMEDG